MTIFVCLTTLRVVQLLTPLYVSTECYLIKHRATLHFAFFSHDGFSLLFGSSPELTSEFANPYIYLVGYLGLGACPSKISTCTGQRREITQIYECFECASNPRSQLEESKSIRALHCTTTAIGKCSNANEFYSRFSCTGCMSVNKSNNEINS
jgi:hypothetical protein